MFPYRFQPTYSGYGIGTGNDAFQRPSTIPINSIYAPRYNVKGDLEVHTGGVLKLIQDGLPVDLRANGVYLSGSLALQSLSEFQKAKG